MNLANFLQERQIDFELIPHIETYDAQHLAAAVHVSGRRVAKTVLLRARTDRGYIVAVLPANQVVDFERVGNLMGDDRIEMATELELSEHCPDCEIGALPPFGSYYGMKTLLDQSFLDEENVVFEGNTHHEAIRMRLADFRRLEEPVVGAFAHEN